MLIDKIYDSTNERQAVSMTNKVIRGWQVLKVPKSNKAFMVSTHGALEVQH